jgi:hypothetical protein
MSAWAKLAPSEDGHPKTLRFCKTCRRETAHEIRMGQGLTATICISCLQRALSYELDRD